MRNKHILLAIVSLVLLSSCLKKNDYWEDFASTQPIADIAKAPANAAVATAPTNSWFILDSAAGPQDYATAVHISAKDHIGDVTIKMKIDNAVGASWIAAHPTAGYTLLPEDLYTVPSLNATIPNAGVFSIGDFVVNIKANADNGSGVSRFKGVKYILPVTIDDASPYGIAANFKTVLWYIRVKLK